MISFRCLFVLLPLLVLAACDNEPAPPIDPVEPPKPRVSTPAAAIVPAPVVAPAAKPAVESPAKQASELVKPSAPPKPVAGKTLFKEAPKASVAKAPVPVPRLELDLSLPTELLESTESLESFSELPSTLLPPLFDDQNPAGPFQLQGKLLTNERGDQDYWESLEGAELQFEFKR